MYDTLKWLGKHSSDFPLLFRPLSDVLHKVQTSVFLWRVSVISLTYHYSINVEGLNVALRKFEKTAEASDVSSAGRLSNRPS